MREDQKITENRQTDLDRLTGQVGAANAGADDSLDEYLDRFGGDA